MDETTLKTIVGLGFNGGAFGVLVIIAFFLMRNLPKWIADHLSTLTDIAATHKEEVTELRDCFVTELKAERAMCDHHHENLMARLEKSNENTAQAFRQVADGLDRHHNELINHINTSTSRRSPH